MPKKVSFENITVEQTVMLVFVYLIIWIFCDKAGEYLRLKQVFDVQSQFKKK